MSTTIPAPQAAPIVPAIARVASIDLIRGAVMILMAGLVKLPLGAVGTMGLAIIAGHNLLDSHVATLIPTLGDNVVGALWKILYVGFYAGPIHFGPDGPTLIVLYSIAPWIGVM